LLDIDDAPTPDLIVKLTDKPAEVRGTVRTDRSGKPVGGASVYAFSTDRALWVGNLPGLGARLRQVRASLDGSFVIRALVPGEYYLVAEDLPEPDWTDRKHLSILVERASRIRIGSAELLTQSLSIPDR
jgi:hypothetical protein